MKPQTVPYRRKREQRTNYRKRIRLLLSGKPRLVVRITNQKIIAQLIEFAPHGDKVVAGLDSFCLRQMGWPASSASCKSIPAAYATGILTGKEAVRKGYQEAILDTGFKSAVRQGRIAAFLKGAVDAGMKIPVTSDTGEIFPSPERLNGQHLKKAVKLNEMLNEIRAKAK